MTRRKSLPRVKGVGKVTDKTIDKFIFPGSGKVMLIAGASWCSDTEHFFKKVLPEYVRLYQGRITFLSVEIEGQTRGVRMNPGIRQRFCIGRYPTLLIFMDEILIGHKSSEESHEAGVQKKDIMELIRILEKWK